MTTVHYLATIQMPCGVPHLCESTRAACPLCNDGTVPAWLVGPWDEQTTWIQGEGDIGGPPAELVALTETCVMVRNGGTCDKCFDGRPAVEVVRRNKRPHQMPRMDQASFRTLGRGTIRPDHILPVLADYPPDDKPATYRHDTSPISRWWYVKASPDGWHVPLGDIDVSPGQYVAIVTPEAT